MARPARSPSEAPTEPMGITMFLYRWATCAAALILTAGSDIAIAQQVPASAFEAARPSGSFDQFGLPVYAGTQPVSQNSYIQVTPAVTNPDGTTIILSGLGLAQNIRLDQFAAATRTQEDQQVRARLDQLSFFVQRDFQRLSEGIALSSALTIMPPNPGDRFAVTIGGAGFNGRGAGAITGTYRVNEGMMVFGGYARSETQNLVKGGATFSFR